MEEFKSLNSTQQNIEYELLNEPEFDPKFRSEHSFYGTVSGKIKPDLISKINPSGDIFDSKVQVLIDKADFYLKNASYCFNQKAIEIFIKYNFSTQDLEKAIKNSPSGDQYYQEYRDTAQKRVILFMQRYKVAKEEAYGCCLALSYYTGVYSERVSRDSNLILKLGLNLHQTSKIVNQDKFKESQCIAHWLYKALNYIPLHWGKVIRCINLQQNEAQMYSQGNIVTWLQFSSSSYGNITDYFSQRNTRFIIYSLSGKCIEKFSNYSNQTEVLFKPYTHFLVLKRVKKQGYLQVHMREIFFGQSFKNILWVDDHILDSNWQNKSIMEKTFLKDPLICIIPKISTETALAFLRSQLGKKRKSREFKIVTDMTRKNQHPSENAGARFVRQALALTNNIKMLIFTSDQKKALQMLAKQNISNNPNVKVTVSVGPALNFLSEFN